VRRLLREPLLHFLLLGALLFAADRFLAGSRALPPDRIVVSAGQVENLAITFARTWQRPPTRAELQALVDDHVETEVLAREAVALDLDRDDTVIRRRLRQKMEFLAEDLAAVAEPTEEELAEYLRAHAEDFRQEPRTSFRHVFLSEERGERLEADAEELLQRLRAAGPETDVDGWGDRLLLPLSFDDEPRASIASQLGTAFAQALDPLPVGTWSGPVRSSYGLHLVLVTGRTPGRPAELAEVRERVRAELVADRRERMRAEMLARLLERYQVVVEWPEEEPRPAEAEASLR